MDVLTSETCRALNKEIIKQVTSIWSLFIQLEGNYLKDNHKVTWMDQKKKKQSIIEKMKILMKS